MTENNIFAYIQTFFVIKYFKLLFILKLQPSLEKGHPFFPSNPLLKVEVQSISLPFFENFVGGLLCHDVMMS